MLSALRYVGLHCFSVVISKHHFISASLRFLDNAYCFFENIDVFRNFTFQPKPTSLALNNVEKTQHNKKLPECCVWKHQTIEQS